MIHFRFYKYVIFSLLILFLNQSCSYTIYVSRHAEKEISENQNPSLTQDGKKRADKLGTYLNDKNVKLIFSTNTERTKKTAEPLAIKSIKTISIYDSKKPDLLLSEIKNLRKNTLIIGHSNTLKYLVNNLSGKTILENDLGDLEYDKLFVITRSAFRKPKAQIYIFK